MITILRRVRTVTFWLILLSIGAGVGYWYATGELNLNTIASRSKVVVNAEQPVEYQDVDFSLFWEVWSKLEKSYLDQEKIDSQQMVYGAIKGMVASLGDPYTVFLPPVEQKRAEEDLSGSFEGVGIQLGYIDSQLAVMSPLRGMPAEKQGVQAGDLILNIKDPTNDVDIDTFNMSLPEAVSYIRGPGGSSVTLTLYRENNGGQPFEVSIVRDTILIPSVELEFVDSGNSKVAHLILSRFGDRTDAEWDQIIDQILAEPKVSGVVLDMRNNPGGYLNGAIYIASEFISDGVVVKQQGKFNTETFSVNRKGRLTQMPVVVLVNRGSASASEIVAGALRDRLQAKIVGAQTFGKGTVQSAEDMRDGTGIHITSGRWLLPGGSWIHETGLTPDRIASDSAQTTDVDEMLEAALEELN